MFKNNTKKPKSLRKKEPSKLEESLKILKLLLKDSEFLICIGFIIIFTCAIIFAMHEAITYFVYNLGGF